MFWNSELLGLSVWYNCKVNATGLVVGKGKGGQGAQGRQFAQLRTLLEEVCLGSFRSHYLEGFHRLPST